MMRTCIAAAAHPRTDCGSASPTLSAATIGGSSSSCLSVVAARAATPSASTCWLSASRPNRRSDCTCKAPMPAQMKWSIH